MVKIDKIAYIQTGLVATRKKATSKDSDFFKYKMLSLKSFEPSGKLITNELEWFKSNEELEGKYLTHLGDIVIRLTAPYTAICINKSETELLVPSNFAIIRIEDNSFLPEYVSMFLNSEKMENEFKRSSVSTTIPLIKTSYLREVEIPEKKLEMQKKLLKFNDLQKKEIILVNNIIKEKLKLAQARIKKILEE